ncbi:MAG: LysR family transcriptional regulator [Pseudomonadota bacterium]
MKISDHTLEAFLALAEVQKFTLAAERCRMTQSALSQLIARLEEFVGVRLFERGKRSVVLTPEGERFAVSARRITTELDSVRNDLRALSKLERGQVSMAVVPSLAAYWLPDILRAYRKRFPHIRTHLSDASSVACQDLVRQGLVDFALSSQTSHTNELEFELLFEEALYVALPSGHALSGRTSLSLDALAGVEFVHLKGTHKMLVRVGDRVLAARQLLADFGAADTGVEVQSLSTVAGLVAAGVGAGFLPHWSLPQFRVPGVVTVQLNPATVVRPIYLSRRRDVSLSAAATSFVTRLREHVRATAPANAVIGTR